MTRRLAQIESTVKQALAKVLQREISDPRIQGMVSITRVKVSPDLHEAYVHVSVIPESKQKVTLHGLRAASGHIHRKLLNELALRTVPRLDFRLDESLKRQADVFDSIREGLDRTAPAPGSAPETAPGSETSSGEQSADEAESISHPPSDISHPSTSPERPAP